MSKRNSKKAVICTLFTCEALSSGVVMASQVYSLNDIPTIPPGGQQQSGDMSLYLLIKINDASTQSLVNVKYNQQKKTFLIRAEDLKSLRLNFKDIPAGNPWVDVSKLPGVKTVYVPDDQILNLYIPDARLTPYQISLNNGPETNYKLLKKNALTSAIINYSLYNTHYNSDDFISASVQGLLNTGVGNFYTSGVYNNKSYYGTEGTVRLDSYWQYIDPEKIRSYTLGDFTTNTVNWGTSVRVAGFQWASAYSQRSDIVTTALPQFSGSSAVPSTLDLFVDQQKIYSGDIPSGPFDIKNLPFVSGNDVTIVTKDANGQQVSSTHAYYYSPDLLRQGINEFSVDIGIPRFNYDAESSDYDNKVVFGSASSKYGLSDSTTLTVNGQGTTNGLSNGGIGIAQGLFGYGVLSLAAAGSHYKDRNGMLGQASLDGRISKNITFNSSYQKSNSNYYDLARVSNLIYQEKYQRNVDEDEYTAITYTSQANEITRAGINYSPFQGWTFGTYFNRLVYSGSRYNLVSFNVNTGIIPNLNISANLYKDLSGNDTGGYIVLTYNFDNKYNISSSVSRDNGRNGYTEQINSIADSGINTGSWGASATQYEGGDNDYQLYGNFRGRYGTYNASVQQYGSQTQTTVSTTGALIFADMGVYPANEVGQSFALVKNAGPGTHILNGGVDLGAADSSGHFLITDMTPYITNHIFLDTTNLPIDWQTQDTEQTAISAYQQGSLVNFKSEKVVSATVLLVDINHQPLPPGYKVVLNDSSESMTGYSGEVYLQQLKRNNTLTVNLLDKGTCTTRFSYDSANSSTVKIGPYVCQ